MRRTSRLSLPQLPGFEPQALAAGPASPSSLVSPTPKIHPQLSLKSSPVRPEPAQPTTPPQQGASRKSGRVPFNWNVVAPGSTRASLCQPPSALDVPSTYTVGPRTHAAAAESLTAGAARAASLHQAGQPGGRKSNVPGQGSPSGGTSPEGGRAVGTRRCQAARPESPGPDMAGLPQLLGEYLEGAKMLGRQAPLPPAYHAALTLTTGRRVAASHNPHRNMLILLSIESRLAETETVGISR